MKIDRKLLNERLDSYACKVFVPNMKGDRKSVNVARFKIGVAHVMGWLGVDDGQFKSMKDKGFADDEGGIDLDLVKKAVDGGLEKSGGELYVERLGIWLTSDDVKNLHAYLETGQLQ